MSKNIDLANSYGKVLFLSSTFLYRKEVEFIKRELEKIKFEGNYRYHIGQYLPEWHPWESYKDFFVSNRETNACREIFAIEMPWLVDTFGIVKTMKVCHKKISSLDIDYDDTYNVLIEHESGVMGNLVVDVVTPRTGRELEIWGEKIYIEWKGAPDTLQIYNCETKRLNEVKLYEATDHIDEYAQFVVENAYYDEMVNFIKSVEGRESPRYSFGQDKYILGLIDRIEE